MNDSEFLSKCKELEAKAMPGEYEVRCREFSNRAPVEIWTEYGWLDTLPRDYREPTYEFIAFARSALPRLIEMCERYQKALEYFANPNSYSSMVLINGPMIAQEALADNKGESE